MTQSQIEYFLAVVQEMSVSRAAEQLYVSQPAVSKQISLLETELGVKLFKRNYQRLEITEAGEEYAALFRRYKKELQELAEKYREESERVFGTAKLGCLEGMDTSLFFPDITTELNETYPGIQLYVTGYNHDHVYQALKRGEVDAVIATESLLRSYPDLEVQHLTQYYAALIYSKRHPLAGKKSLKLEDFKDYPFVVTVMKEIKPATKELVAKCEECGFTPKIEYSPTTSACLMKIQSGTGVLMTLDCMRGTKHPLYAHTILDYKRDVAIASLKEKRNRVSDIVINEVIDYFTNRYGR